MCRWWDNSIPQTRRDHTLPSPSSSDGSGAGQGSSRRTACTTHGMLVAAGGRQQQRTRCCPASRSAYLATYAGSWMDTSNLLHGKEEGDR